VNDVTFSYNAGNRPESKTTRVFRPVRQVVAGAKSTASCCDTSITADPLLGSGFAELREDGVPRPYQPRWKTVTEPVRFYVPPDTTQVIFLRSSFQPTVLIGTETTKSNNNKAQPSTISITTLPTNKPFNKLRQREQNRTVCRSSVLSSQNVCWLHRMLPPGESR